MITCLIRYTLDLSKYDEFIEYSKSWESFIKKYGGFVHGFFAPYKNSKPKVPLSFSSIGKEGADNIAIALFSFPSTKEYEKYTAEVKKNLEYQKVCAKFKGAPFLNYERTFLSPITLFNQCEPDKSSV